MRVVGRCNRPNLPAGSTRERGPRLVPRAIYRFLRRARAALREAGTNTIRLRRLRRAIIASSVDVGAD